MAPASRSESRRGPLTLLRCAQSTSPRTRGGVNKQSHSRDAAASELCKTTARTTARNLVASKKEGGGAPKGAPTMSAPHIQALPLERARAQTRGFAAEPPAPARLPALHRGSCLATECFDSAQAALHAIERERALPAPSIALKPSTWLAGRNAGGDDARTARERSVSLRPREPHSLPSVSTLGRKVPL